MFDIGLGEFVVLAALALLVFGPDRLPTVTAQATHWLRQLREQAASARAELADTVDLDSTGLKDLADLHPKRIAASVLAPVEEVRKQVVDAGASAQAAVTGAAPASAGATPASPAKPAPAAPAAPAHQASTLFDPDAT